MPRTKSPDVEALLAQNWDGFPAYRNSAPTAVQPYIDTAYIVVNQVVALNNTNFRATLGTDTLEMMERWLACWYYTKGDPMYRQRSTERASGAFIAGLKEPEYYKDGAISVDPTGYLNALLNRLFASASWGGRNAIAQTPLDERT